MSVKRKDFVSLNIYIPKDIIDNLREMAEKEHRCVGNMARILIIKGVGEESAKKNS